ncbi:MAG: MATE family efflux transporter [Tessaracoccus sp.]
MKRGVPVFQRKGLLRLSWPLLVVTVFTLLATLGNVVLLSLASPELNAAVATANQLLGVVYDLSVIFSIGALVVIAQLLGAGALADAQRSSIVVLRASMVLGVAMAAGVAVLAPLLVRWINTPAEIADDAVSYLWVVCGGLFFNAYIVAASAVLRAYGRTVALLVLGVVVNLLDVALLAFFLLVLEWGPVGAAMPTLLVRGVGMLLLWGLVRRVTGARVLSPLPPRDPAIDGGPWRMATLSLPSVVENAAYNGAIVATVSLINMLGTDTINARSYALTLTALVTGVILALAQGNETIVGWDVGERDVAHARRQTVRTAAGTALASAVLAALLWLGADAALSVFGPNAQVVAGAREALAISIVLLPLSAITAVVYGALRSSGDVVVPMIYSVASSALLLVPASWLFISQLGLGLAGAFWALAAAEGVKAALLLGRLLRGRWASRPSVLRSASQ